MDYIVGAVSTAFPGVGRADVTATWAGLRPLLGGRTGPTADLSRKHRIFEDPPGLVTITGGKLTTYRFMAQQLVDRVARALGTGAKCRTRELREDPSLAEPVAQGLPVRAVEVELARTREMAITDTDVLVRRTRLATMDSTVTLPAR